MPDGHFGPLPESDGNYPVRSGRFIDVEVYGNLNAVSGTLGDLEITGSVTIGAGGSLQVGDVESDNWGGASPANLTARDTSGTPAGYYLDASVGSAQFEGDLFVGGDIDLTGNLTVTTNGIIRTAASGQRLELTNADENRIYGYTGDAAEVTPGHLNIDTNGAGAGRSLQWEIKTPQVDVDQPIITLVLSSGSVDGTTNAPGLAVAFGASAGDNSFGLQPTFSINNEIPVLASGQVRGPDGSAAAPSFAFMNDTDTGMYLFGTDRLGFSIGGTHVAEFNNGKLRTATTATGSPEILFGSSTGSATNPVYSFQGDSNTGMYRSASDVLAWTTGGTARMTLSNTEHTLASGVEYLGQPGTTGTAANATWIVASGSIYKLQRSTSAAKYKTDVRHADDLADLDIRPRRYWSLLDETEQVGFIADEVAAVLPEAAVYGADGEIENYDTRAVIAVLAAKVDRLEKQMEKCRCE